MPWRDRFQGTPEGGSAAWRGIRFHVERSSVEGARRWPEHKFPGRDGSEYEDLGRDDEDFSISGYVLGEDYDLVQGQLLKAFNEGSEGELIHPYYGTFRGIVRGFRITHDREVGNRVDFTFQFRSITRSGFGPDPTPRSQIKKAADSAAEAGFEEYQETVVTEGVQSLVLEPLGTGIGGLGTLLEAQAIFNGAKQRVRSLQNSIQSMIRRASELATAPAQFVEELRNVYQQILATRENAIGSLFVYRLMFQRAEFAPERSGTPLLDIKNGNGLRLQNVIRGAAIAGWARSAVDLVHDSLPAAQATRNELLDAILEWESSSLSVESEAALLRGLVREFVPQNPEQLPDVGSYCTRRDTTVFHVLNDLYAALDREPELLRRNKIRDPGNLPAKQCLEVLIDPS